MDTIAKPHPFEVVLQLLVFFGVLGIGILSSISNLDGKIEALGGCVTSLTNLKNEITSSLVKIEALGKQVNEGKTEIISELREKYNGLNESVSGLSRDIATENLNNPEYMERAKDVLVEIGGRWSD